ncbi:MAG: hypothetical protein PVH91_01690 [Pseudomonadales bacterium]|jgi:DNA-binding MarR family transcriptional regulator
MSDPLNEYKHAIRTINFLVEVMAKEVAPEISLNQLRVLTEVMYRTTIGVRADMGDIGKSLRLNRGALSRLVATLTAEGYGDRPGMDLINRVEYVRDRRKKTLTLTERGRQVCEVFGVSMRRAALDSLDRYMELLTEQSNPTVRVGIDCDCGVCVYLVSGLYLTGTYRQIITCMSRMPDYRIVYNEITDLTDAETFEMDDAGVQAGIAIEKSIAGLTRRRVFLAKDAGVLSRLEEIEAQFRNAGLETFRCARSLDEARETLGLPADWQYPKTSLLKI